MVTLTRILADLGIFFIGFAIGYLIKGVNTNNSSETSDNLQEKETTAIAPPSPEDSLSKEVEYEDNKQ